MVGFTCQIGHRAIKGTVKEREQARKEYNRAKDNNQFAGLLQRSEKADDVFLTSLGNVPAGATVSVEIVYLGELKHDAEVDGLRYTIPTIIAPRYGPEESLVGASNVSATSMSIIVDAEMPSAIKAVQSPSHSISVNIGTTSVKPDAERNFRRASASLAFDSPRLDKDFVLQLTAADLGQPTAMMETHPDFPNHRALMATLVPKFGVPSIKPEIVFLCDRSGSMGDRLGDLRSALLIFLKSLPPGVKFNICSFGDHFEFLWEKSSSYSETSLEQALKYVDSFKANFGGTEMFEPMKHAFARRFPDIELEVILLTDGQIWDQDKLFDLIRSEVASSNGSIRVFTLGIGYGASSSLIEGAARAGNGASQTVNDDEKMDKKVIRTLKASLSPHVTDYALEIKYEKDDTDDYELVEKVVPEVTIEADADLTMAESPNDTSNKHPVITSLYDPSYKGDDATTPEAPSSGVRFADLPIVHPPSYLQAPHQIPQLFAYNRTSIYVLLSESTANRRAKSVLLRGTSKQGPLELEIEVHHLEKPGRTIHQLAARKAVEDLEGDGGWLSRARLVSGELLKDARASQFSDMVEREAIRLGTKYQVSNKWCSFVAVEEQEGGMKVKSMVEDFQVVPEGGGMASSVPFTLPVAPVILQPRGATRIGRVTAHRAPRRQLASKAMRRAPPSDTRCASGRGSPPCDDDKFSMPLHVLGQLVALQTFSGNWAWTKQLEEIIGAEEQKLKELGWPGCADENEDARVSATICVILFFRSKLAGEKETWEMVVEKAENYLTETTGHTVEELAKIARQGYEVPEP